MARIAIGGWQHETNTFATIKADYKAFEDADEWPAMQQGDTLVSNVREVHLPITGAIQAIEEQHHDIVPLLWCSATPCSYVTQDAFEKITANMLKLIEQSLPLDGIYLDLHGAMVCEHIEDGEGELLSRIRKITGSELPLFVSLDLHANVTPLMVEQATLIDIFRTYPHIDMGETGYRTARLLCDYLDQPVKLYKEYQQIDFMIPLNTGCTLIEPCQTLYANLPERVKREVSAVAFACGFHLSDIRDVGPAVVAYGTDKQQVQLAVESVVNEINASKKSFHEKIWPAAEGVEEARRCYESVGGTIVMADTQDNPGGGGAGDTIGVLQAMIDQKLENAAVGVINDEAAAKAAHEAGIGAELNINLGGKAGPAGRDTLDCTARVRNLSDGRFVATGPMYKGAHMELGATALLEISGIKVVVCSRAVQTADQAHFRHLGVDPSKLDYIAVKSSVHFRNDYTELASAILVISSPGEVYADPSTLHYNRARPEIERTKMC